MSSLWYQLISLGVNEMRALMLLEQAPPSPHAPLNWGGGLSLEHHLIALSSLRTLTTLQTTFLPTQASATRVFSAELITLEAPAHTKE